MNGWDDPEDGQRPDEVIDSNLLTSWSTLFQLMQMVGSRVTCDPAPTDTDIDYLCFSPWWKGSQALELQRAGFKLESEEYADEFEPTRFLSFRKGEGAGAVNLIVTADLDFYEKFLLATRVCTRLNIADKDDRRALFQAVVYSRDFED